MANPKHTIDGISYYAKVYQPDTMSDAYTVDLVVSDEDAATLEALGLSAAKDRAGNLKSHGHEGKVFKFKRKVRTRKGDELGAPTVADSQGNIITDIIGNGSKVRVHFTTYNYRTPAGVEGVSAGLNAVQVLDLVEFKSEPKKSSGIEAVAGGYISKASDEDII